MIEQNKYYLANFTKLIIILQLALMLYITIGLDIITLSKFYEILLNYSLLLSSVPIIFGLFILLSKNIGQISNLSMNDSNGYITGNGISHTEDNKDNRLSYYLIMLGILVLLYNTIIRIIEPPFYISLSLPIIIFSGFILKQYKPRSNYN